MEIFLQTLFFNDRKKGKDMNKLKTLSAASALLAGSVFAGQASAFTINFMNEDVWGNPAGNDANYFAPSADHTYSASDTGSVALQVSVTSLPASTTSIAWENADGFGVNGQGDSAIWDDDIENFNGTPLTEILVVSFSPNVLVNSIEIADFEGSGQYNTGSGWTNFGPNNPSAIGHETFAISTTASNGISFRAFGNSSFQVASLDVEVAPVPLPPAVWLLGSAMVFLLRKRQVS